MSFIFTATQSLNATDCRKTEENEGQSLLISRKKNFLTIKKQKHLALLRLTPVEQPINKYEVVTTPIWSYHDFSRNSFRAVTVRK